MSAPADVSLRHQQSGATDGGGLGTWPTVLPPPPRTETDRTTFGLIGAVVLGAVVAIVLGLLLPGLSPGVPVVAGVVVVAVGVGVVVRLRWRAARLGLEMLRALRAEPLAAPEAARLRNLVDDLSLSFGLVSPDVAVVPDDRPGLAAVDGGGTATLVATSGLVGQLNAGQVDLVVAEAAVAHVLAHLRAGHARHRCRQAVGRQSGDPGPEASWIADELVADRWTLAITRYPPGLVAALQWLHPPAGPAGAGGWRPLWEGLEPFATGTSGPESTGATDDTNASLGRLRLEVLSDL
jgi:hypothetical protein